MLLPIESSTREYSFVEGQSNGAGPRVSHKICYRVCGYLLDDRQMGRVSEDTADFLLAHVHKHLDCDGVLDTAVDVQEDQAAVRARRLEYEWRN